MASKASITLTMRAPIGISSPLQPRRIAAAVVLLVVVQREEAGPLEARAPGAAPPTRTRGCMRITRHSRHRAGPACWRMASGTPTLPASCSRAATSMSSQQALVQPQLLSDAHGPFRQARAVHAGVEVLEVQHLVERADGRLARRRQLLLQLAHAAAESTRTAGSAPAAGRPITGARSSRRLPTRRCRGTGLEGAPGHSRAHGRTPDRCPGGPSRARWTGAWPARRRTTPGSGSALGFMPAEQRGRPRHEGRAEGRSRRGRVAAPGIGGDDPLSGGGQPHQVGAVVRERGARRPRSLVEATPMTLP